MRGPIGIEIMSYRDHVFLGQWPAAPARVATGRNDVDQLALDHDLHIDAGMSALKSGHDRRAIIKRLAPVNFQP